MKMVRHGGATSCGHGVLWCTLTGVNRAVYGGIVASAEHFQKQVAIIHRKKGAIHRLYYSTAYNKTMLFRAYKLHFIAVAITFPVIGRADHDPG